MSKVRPELSVSFIDNNNDALYEDYVRFYRNANQNETKCRTVGSVNWMHIEKHR